MQKKNCFFTSISFCVALDEVFAGNIFANYAAKLFRVDLSCISPNVGTTSIGKHSNLKSLWKLLTFSPTNKGCLDVFLDVPADIISNGAPLFSPRFPEAWVTKSEGRGKFSENFIAECVVLPVVRLAGAFLCWPRGIEDQQRS